MNQRGFVIPSPTMLLGGVALALGLSTVLFWRLYASTLEDYRTFQANVEAAMAELHRIREVREAEYKKVNDEATVGWNAALDELRRRPRIRVFAPCNQGGVSAVSIAPAGTHDPAEELGPTLSVEQCEDRVNLALEDALKVVKLQDWILKTHEASKKK